MTGGKYSKYIQTEPFSRMDQIYPEITADGISIKGEEWSKVTNQSVEYGMGLICVDKPFLMVKEAHSHDFDQFLCFIGGDSLNVREFDAEVELCLGEEEEKQIITTSTVVYVPKGLVHCPLEFKKVNKPIVFVDIMLTSDYSRKEVSE